MSYLVSSLLFLLLIMSILGHHLDHLLFVTVLCGCLHFFPLFLFLLFLHWINFTDLSSSLLNLSFVISICLLSLSSEILFIGIILFSSRFLVLLFYYNFYFSPVISWLFIESIFSFTSLRIVIDQF